MNWSLDRYKTIITEEKNRTGEDPQVVVNGQYLNTFNNNNEDIPILYTRDYILGQQEGDTHLKVEDVKDTWINPSSMAYAASIPNGRITRLSWLRFDNLIWEALEEILQGKIRHTSGRYTDMGGSDNSGTSIEKELFGIGESIAGGISVTDKNTDDFATVTGPILGQGVQEGLIMYHAMPFHRYWFHRCRQVLYNMKRWDTLRGEKPDEDEYESYEGIKTEVHDLQDFMKTGLITSACKASITPHHSLVKDFLLCNGNEVSFENFPNISLMNGNLLKTEKPGKEAELVNDKFQNKTSWDDKGDSATYLALKNTNSGKQGGIKLPNLFTFNEKYPRFIRALNWDNGVGSSNYDAVVNVGRGSTSYSNITAQNTKRWVHSSKVNMDYDKGERDVSKKEEDLDKDIWGVSGLNIPKNITEVKLHTYNYDYAVNNKKHFHYLFTNKIGGSNEEEKIYDEKGNETEKTFKEAAAFVTYGTYGGITIKVANNET